MLVIDNDPRSAAQIMEWARAIGCELVEHATTMASAWVLLAEGRHRLVVCEAVLPEGDCLPVVRAARGLANPAWVVTTSARANQALIGEINKAGGVHIEKPVRSHALSQLIESLAQSERFCREMARKLVGCLGLKEAQDLLRHEMYNEALARTGGNRRKAARILGVDRRCVQRLVDEVAERHERSRSRTGAGNL